ncbi:MAG TPA: GH25 family lysozyme [Thermoanaerobaculia bacterium]|nr:GH25 family lysozyme [Thermoanaerobaculia bacterium]
MRPLVVATRPDRGALAVLLSLLAVAGCGEERSASGVPAEGTTDSTTEPAPLLALGEQVTCVTGESPVCVGRGVFQVPADPAVLAGARALAFGLRHGCLLDERDAALCWGDALDGQLGVDPATLAERHLGRPTRAAAGPVPGAPALASLTAGWVHTCGLTHEGGVACWGDNALGQLGREGTAAVDAAPVAGLADVSALSAGGLHTCAVDGAGAIACWGDGTSGQLGAGSTDDAFAPVAVQGLGAAATAVAAGAYHTCALLADGSVSCWGDNRFGQVGDGTRERRMVATPVSGLAGPARTVAAGSSFSCALLEDGTVQCWGSDELGELGSGRPSAPAGEQNASPAAGSAVAGLPGPAVLLAAAGTHACARLQDGGTSCWGGNDSGQLGDGTRQLRRSAVAWRGARPPAPAAAPPALEPPAEGIDVSYHSGHVDWSAARAAGYRFGLTLATAGVDFRDPFLASHWARIHEAGLVRGAYHFYIAADDPVAQAHHFLSHVVLEPGDLRPVVDIESAAQEPPADLARQLARFVAEIEAAIGVAPIVYTGAIFWRDHVATTAFADHPLWIAEYEVDQPEIPAGWDRWDLWQWQGNAALPHIAPIVDLDRLHADADVDELLIPAAGIDHAPPPP